MEHWEKYTELKHLEGFQKEVMERRKRHKMVRYIMFRLQTQLENGEPLKDPHPSDIPNLHVPLPGFIEFWLKEVPLYAVQPTSDGGKTKVQIPEQFKKKTVVELGGYAEFAKKWDVDADLKAYLRWSSVWQEWNAVLARVVPIIGE